MNGRGNRTIRALRGRVIPAGRTFLELYTAHFDDQWAM
jgi:hypothetical protein